jgi:hypothetical protein
VPHLLHSSTLATHSFWDFLRKRLLLLLNAGVDVVFVFDGARLPAKDQVEEARAR